MIVSILMNTATIYVIISVMPCSDFAYMGVSENRGP